MAGRAEQAPPRSLDAPPGGHPFDGAVGVLRTVGGTPLVRLGRSVEGLVPAGVEIHAKLEGRNPGGSVKDRPALAIVLDARRRGRLEGRRMLDASSGNTGIAYAMIGAVLGHELTLCLPANANRERKQLLLAYGAEVIETSPLEGSDGAIVRARRLAEEQPGRFAYLDQYNNPANWWAHYGSTAPEILAQTEGRVTHFVATLGTSGTFMGTSRGLRAARPDVVCVAVQPDSPFHGLEGLKHMETAIVPGIYDAAEADRHLGAPSEEAFDLCRSLARDEGLLVGPSSGAALWAAIEVARELDRGVVVTVFPDGGERYLSDAHLFGGGH